MGIMHFLILSLSILSSVASEDAPSTGDNKSIDNVVNDISKSTLTISRLLDEFLYILRCEHTEQVMWTCQNYTMSNQKSYIPQGNNMKFGIILIILGTQSFENNRCFCYKNSTSDANLAENELVSSIYVHKLDDKNSVPLGSEFRLQCRFKSETKTDNPNRFKFKWILPNDLQWNQSRQYHYSLPFGVYKSILVIPYAVTEDSGNYTCQFVSYKLQSDRSEEETHLKSTYAMTVKNIDDYSELVNKYYYDYLIFKSNTTAKIGVCYSGYGLELNPEWYYTDNMKIVNNKKYYIDNDNDCSILNVNNARLLDSGTYVTLDTHLLNLEHLHFNLTIEDVPNVRVENVFLGTNEKASIQCKVLSYPKALVTWTFEPCSAWNMCSAELIEITSNTTSSPGATSIEYIYTLTFMPTSSGIIRCKAVNIIGTAIDQGHVIIRPTNDNMTIYSTMDNEVIKLGDNVTITCAAFAFYFSNNIHWYNRNGKLINETENIAIHSSLNYYYYTKSLTFKSITKSDQGQYECQARLRNSTTTKSITKIFIPVDIPGFRTSWIAVICLFILILISVVIYLCIRVKQKSKLLEELKAAGLENFEEGAVDQLNPFLTLDEQADLLPYDRRFEFPKDKLKLGQQLGAGAFGTVFKAYAEGIKPNEKETVVAVKMVKRDANNEVIKALVSELKIMVHMGRHLNVINLLGAVTKNISKHQILSALGELMVIVEFCDYGSIRNFLICNRKKYINQIDPNTGIINASLMTQTCLNNSLLKTNCGSKIDSDYLNSSGICMEHSELYETPTEEIDVLKTDRRDDSDIGLSNEYIQSDPYSEYKSDLTDEIIVTTSDLISWSYQLACGMEYLSSMNILHGDLAARNILLCKDYIVKICDFGLARSIYKGDNYKKQGNAVLPIKWLALESLSDHIFSTYTDVWAFGIVMWELFSLATVPYPDIFSYQNLYNKLKDGYRMEKPPYANNDLYYIMLECWSTNPEKRPLFNVLKEKLAVILGEEITNHYVVINEPYLKVNAENCNLKDYLTLLRSPDEVAPQP